MARRVRFGVFDFDSETGELRREGSPVRLQAQPAQVLGFLVAHAGDVVTREQLREAVWGNETFVDFDRSINYCVAQIRSALGDSAEAPRFVRTIPKRGYQFLGPVERDEPVLVAAQAAIPSRRVRKRKLAAAALAVMSAGVVTAVVLERIRPVKIAVARFDNETGNAQIAAYSDRLTDLVVADLTAGAPKKFRIIGNAAVLRGPREGRDIRKIGQSLDASYIILGQVQKTASGYRILAHLIHLPEQTHLDVVRYESKFDDGLPSEEKLGEGIRAEFLRRLGS